MIRIFIASLTLSALAAACGGSGLEGSGPDLGDPADTGPADTVLADTSGDDIDVDTVSDSAPLSDTVADTVSAVDTLADSDAPTDTSEGDTLTDDGDTLEDSGSDGDGGDVDLDAPDTARPPCRVDLHCADFAVEPCEIARCDTTTGACVAEAAAEDAACEDGNLCTTGERCKGGTCVPTEAVKCEDDGNVCTDDFCDPAAGCTYRQNFGPCANGDPCTVADYCVGGRCLAGAAKCDDDNPCTVDICAADGTCTYPADDNVSCEDGSECTGGDFCADGVCVGGPDNGCDDGNPCTVAECAGDGATCAVEALHGVPCSDDDVCTDGDTCTNGVCTPGEDIDCGGNRYCIDWECDRVDGCIMVDINDGSWCTDSDRCTLGDRCDETGACAPSSYLDCDDDNPCTADSCDAARGCLHERLTGACDDGTACTTGDVCTGGQCVGELVDCDDGDACSRDSCDPLVGCQNVPNGVRCDDGNPCTDDRCDPEDGCDFEPNEAPCDDQERCTIDDTCVLGSCVGTPETCEDDDACTFDVCDAEEGCHNIPFDGPCEDGDLCTDGEVCAGGVCAGGSPIDEDDGIACTIDACTADGGVTHTPDHDACATGEACSPTAGCEEVAPLVLISKIALEPGLGGEAGFGQWVQLTNVTDAVLDLGGYALRGATPGATRAALRPIDGVAGDAILIAPGEHLTAVKASANAPPAGWDAYDLAFGMAADGVALRTPSEVSIVLADGADLQIDRVALGVITGGPAVLAHEFPTVAGRALVFDPDLLEPATQPNANDLPRGWCLAAPGDAPDAPAPRCSDARLNEVRLAGPDGARWVELYLPAGGAIDGMTLVLVEEDGDIEGSVALTGRMPLSGAFVARDGVANVTLPRLTDGSVQLLDPRGALLDVYGFGSLDKTVDDVRRLPLFEGSPGARMADDDVAFRPVDGADTDDNLADWTRSATGSPGELNAPHAR